MRACVCVCERVCMGGGGGGGGTIMGLGTILFCSRGNQYWPISAINNQLSGKKPYQCNGHLLIESPVMANCVCKSP